MDLRTLFLLLAAGSLCLGEGETDGDSPPPVHDPATGLELRISPHESFYSPPTYEVWRDPRNDAGMDSRPDVAYFTNNFPVSLKVKLYLPNLWRREEDDDTGIVPRARISDGGADWWQYLQLRLAGAMENGQELPAPEYTLTADPTATVFGQSSGPWLEAGKFTARVYTLQGPNGSALPPGAYDLYGVLDTRHAPPQSQILRTNLRGYPFLRIDVLKSGEAGKEVEEALAAVAYEWDRDPVRTWKAVRLLRERYPDDARVASYTAKFLDDLGEYPRLAPMYHSLAITYAGGKDSEATSHIEKERVGLSKEWEGYVSLLSDVVGERTLEGKLRAVLALKAKTEAEKASVYFFLLLFTYRYRHILPPEVLAALEELIQENEKTETRAGALDYFLNEKLPPLKTRIDKVLAAGGLDGNETQVPWVSPPPDGKDGPAAILTPGHAPTPSPTNGPPGQRPAPEDSNRHLIWAAVGLIACALLASAIALRRRRG